MSKSVSVDDYFAHLADAARPHMETLRELSRAAAPNVIETLHWNNPAYLEDDVRLWMLQPFAKHCSVRFPPQQFGSHRAEVKEAGYESGEGFIKLPYDRELPVDLLQQLIQYRLADFAASGSTWSDR